MVAVVVCEVFLALEKFSSSVILFLQLRSLVGLLSFGLLTRCRRGSNVAICESTEGCAGLHSHCIMQQQRDF